MTKPTRQSEIKREWHMIDVKDQTLGRVATHIAQLLIGKSKAYFVRNLDCGDYVVVINAKDVAVSGKKEKEKKYFRYSGYPGGLSSRTLQELRSNDPRKIIVHAVKGMLPQNRLRDRILKRLYVYVDENHKHEDKFHPKDDQPEAEK